MQFDPTAFIQQYQDLFITAATVVALGTLSLVAAAVSIMLVLKAEQ